MMGWRRRRRLHALGKWSAVRLGLDAGWTPGLGYIQFCSWQVGYEPATSAVLADRAVSLREWGRTSPRTSSRVGSTRRSGIVPRLGYSSWTEYGTVLLSVEKHAPATQLQIPEDSSPHHPDHPDHTHHPHRCENHNSLSEPHFCCLTCSTVRFHRLSRRLFAC